MKYLIILFVLIATAVFAQIEQRPDQMEQLLWWDLTIIPASEEEDTVYADELADNGMTASNGDTIYAELYITGDVIRSMNFILQYGYYHNYQPNSYYNNILTLSAITWDSTALGIDSTGLLQYINDTNTKRFMFYYEDTANVYGMNPDTAVVKLKFIVSSSVDGAQILGVPLSESISPHGYTLRYWTDLFNPALKPYSTWIHNATITVE